MNVGMHVCMLTYVYPCLVLCNCMYINVCRRTSARYRDQCEPWMMVKSNVSRAHSDSAQQVLECNDVIASSVPGSVVEMYCQKLQQSLSAVVSDKSAQVA